MSAQSSRSALRWRSVEVDARRGAAMRLRPAPGRARARESTRELSQAKREVESSEASGRVGSASASSLPVLDSATCPWVPGGAWRRATTADRRTDCARRERCAMSAQSDRGAHRRWTVGNGDVRPDRERRADTLDDPKPASEARAAHAERDVCPFKSCFAASLDRRLGCTALHPRADRRGSTRAMAVLRREDSARATHASRRAHTQCSGPGSLTRVARGGARNPPRPRCFRGSPLHGGPGVRLARRLHSPTHPLAGSCGCASAFATSRSPARSNPREPRGPPT